MLAMIRFNGMHCQYTSISSQEIMYKLESQVIKLLLDADFFLGTKIIASSLQGTLFPIW